MGLAPSEFYALRYSELKLLLAGRADAHKRALRQRREESAWIVAWLLLPHKGPDAEPVTPDQLMGRKPRTAPARKFASPAQAADAFFSALEAQSKGEA
jgi:hypothetical protein